jgi:hypothetical protein
MVFVILCASDVVGIGCKNTIQGTEQFNSLPVSHSALYQLHVPYVNNKKLYF